MGIGNYRHADGKTAIANPYDHIDETSDELDIEHERSLAWADLTDEIVAAALDQSIMSVAPNRTWRSRRGHASDELVLAQNNLYQVWVHEDSYGHVFITYGLHENLDGALDGLARHHLEARAQRFFDRLQEMVELRIATSPWTSAPRAGAAERLAA